MINPVAKYKTVILSGLILIVLGLNLSGWPDQFRDLHRRQNRALLNFAGLKFSGLDRTFAGVKKVGYMTDKDMSLRENQLQFSQAQYILSPVLLDLNNTGHRFLLFDYTTEEKAFRDVLRFGAVPLKKNQFGIILAHRSDE